MIIYQYRQNTAVFHGTLNECADYLSQFSSRKEVEPEDASRILYPLKKAASLLKEFCEASYKINEQERKKLLQKREQAVKKVKEASEIIKQKKHKYKNDNLTHQRLGLIENILTEAGTFLEVGNAEMRLLYQRQAALNFPKY